MEEDSSPGGATELSPALQRWEELKELIQVPEGRPSPRAHAPMLGKNQDFGGRSLFRRNQRQ